MVRPTPLEQIGNNREKNLVVRFGGSFIRHAGRETLRRLGIGQSSLVLFSARQTLNMSVLNVTDAVLLYVRPLNLGVEVVVAPNIARIGIRSMQSSCVEHLVDHLLIPGLFNSSKGYLMITTVD